MRRGVPRSALAILGLALAWSPACVERKLLLRSEPTGLRAYVDRELVGTTPTETTFDFYGDREIVLLHEPGPDETPAWRPLRVLVPVAAPWYQWFPIDFVFDVLLPFTIRDHRTITLRLEPLGPDPTTEELLQLEERVEAMRRELS